MESYVFMSLLFIAHLGSTLIIAAFCSLHVYIEHCLPRRCDWQPALTPMKAILARDL